MKTITVANQKGGVAKTTTAVSLAHGLAYRGKEVLLVDVDPQGQCASALGLEQEPGIFNLLVSGKPVRDVVRTTRRQGLYLIPGDKRTATAQTLLALERAGEIGILLETLRSGLNGRGPDYVVMDTAPSVGGLQEMALWSADGVLIPTATDGLAIGGVAEIVATLERLAQRHQWQGTILGVLPTFYDEITRESQTVLADLRTSLGEGLVLDPIHRATALRECAANGQTIFEWDARSRAAQEYAGLVWLVVENYD